MSALASLLLVVVTAALLTPPAAKADPYVSIVGAFNGGEYVPGTWVPLRLQVSNDTGSEIAGSVDADELPMGDGAIRFTLPLTVPANSRSRVTIYLPLGMPEPAGKGKSIPPVATFIWNRDGGRLTQSDLLLRASTEEGDSAPRRSAFLALIGDTYGDGDSYDFFGVSKVIADVTGSKIVNWSAGGTQGAALHPVAYDSCRVVGMGGIAPSEMPPAQREALLSWVRSGGTLWVAAPTGVADPRGTWLASYLPVRPIGERLSDAIKTTEIGPLPLRESVTVSEALPAADGVVVLRDEHYVHAAYKPLGLGRVVFTSFPPGAPKAETDAAMRDVWVKLLNLTAADPSWASTQLPDRSPDFLREMIGAPAPARGVAVALAAGFVGVVVLVQLFWRGARRPVAFAAVAIVAVAGSAALVAIGLAAQSTAPLTSGRVSLATLGGGGGIVQEAVAFTGDQPDLSLTVEPSSATLRPLAFDSTNPPTLTANPFAAPDAGAAARRIDRVWQADAAAPVGVSAGATGVFDQDGLKLSVDNAVGATLVAPVLLHGSSVYRLQALADGTSQTTVTGETRNPSSPPTATTGAQDAAAAEQARRERAMKYLNGGPILTELDQLRASMLSATFARRSGADTMQSMAAPGTTIAGWIESTTAAGVPSPVRPSVEPEVSRSLALVTFPVTLRPSPAGSTVKIDRGFNTMTAGQIAIPVYDASTGTWLSSGQPGTWQIGFRPPPQVGDVRPTRVTLHGNASLPAHTLTVRRGQVRGGKPAPNPAGDEVVRWANTFGAQPSVTFDVAPADHDVTGTVWLLVDVETPPPSGGVMPLWSITELGVDIEGVVQNEDRR